MAKGSGGTRTLTPHGRRWSKQKSKADAMAGSGRYSEVSFNSTNGAIFAIEKSISRHKPEEIEAARFIVKSGRDVTLINGAGSAITGDGRIHIDLYEQRTPTGGDAKNFRSALGHARDKKAAVAVVYMKYASHNRTTVEEGIKEFENSSKYRFKRIIVVAKDGKVYSHYHNKK